MSVANERTLTAEEEMMVFYMAGLVMEKLTENQQKIVGKMLEKLSKQGGDSRHE